jgi:flavin reductase (DIM6/NTAB) family NADH-FMN oxidoreductase RutF
MTALEHAPAAAADALREVMAGVATPVSVVTTLAGGRPHGTTVSAFTSLSMSPPMVLVSLDRRSGLLARLAQGSPFGVNVLGQGQADLALRFARSGPDGFDDVAWRAEAGAARLLGSPGWLACRVARLVDGGDHVIVLGDVLVANRADGAPLTYHARAFGTHVAAGQAPPAASAAERRAVAISSSARAASTPSPARTPSSPSASSIASSTCSVPT